MHCFERHTLSQKLNSACPSDRGALNDEISQVMSACLSPFHAFNGLKDVIALSATLSILHFPIASGVRLMPEDMTADALLPVSDYNSRFDRMLVVDYSFGSDRSRRHSSDNEDLQRRRSRSSSEKCGIDQFAIPEQVVKKFQRVDNNSFYVYVLTEDCQVVIARPDQLPQIPRAIKVDRRFTQCQPQLAQIHWRSSPSADSQEESADGLSLKCDNMSGVCDHQNGKLLRLELVLKRSERQICSLPIDLPPEDLLAVADSPFTYSLRAAVLNFAVCSLLPNSSFLLQPKLSFADTLYKDVLYFIDPTSKDTFWTARQFKRDSIGYLHLLDVFEIRGVADGVSASHINAATDPLKRRLFLMQKQAKIGCYDLYATNAYNLVFRPRLVSVEDIRICVPAAQRERSLRKPSAHHAKTSSQIDSLSVDANIILFGESRRANVEGDDGFVTRVYLSKYNSDTNDTVEAKCALEVQFRAKFGIVGARSLRELRENSLPNLGERKRESTLELSSSNETQLYESVFDEHKLSKTKNDTHKHQGKGEKHLPMKTYGDNTEIGNKMLFKEAVLRMNNRSRNDAVRSTILFFNKILFNAFIIRYFSNSLVDSLCL